MYQDILVQSNENDGQARYLVGRDACCQAQQPELDLLVMHGIEAKKQIAQGALQLLHVHCDSQALTCTHA